MHRTIMKDIHLENALRMNGYVILPLLSQQEVDFLRDSYYANTPGNKIGFHSTSTNNDLVYRKQVNDWIQGIFNRYIQDLLVDYEPVYASFVVKEPGMEGNFPLHMDWAMVDESQFLSLAFWTPLVDTNEHNGALVILEKSHTLGMSYRGGPFLFQALENNSTLQSKFEKKTLYLKAGEVIIYDHRLFHGSLPNHTSQTRPALNCTFKPKEAALIHYQHRDGAIEKYMIDPTFFIDYVMGNHPSQQYQWSKINAQQLLFLDDQLISQLER